MDSLLPIGTVVSIGDETNGYVTVVIAGYGGQSADKQVYDYIGFIYPYGFVSRDKIILFETALIHEVMHQGYEDEDYKEVIPGIKKVVDEKKGGPVIV